MKDIVREYQEKFRRSRKTLRRYTALLLALSLTTMLFVNWQLHSVGIAKTAEYLCNEEEHEHTAACYEKVLVCGYEEGQPEDWTVVQPSDDALFDSAFGVDTADTVADTSLADASAEPEFIFVPHEHTDDCYQEVQTLTCYEEEHVHTDDCYDPEDGATFICDKFEHVHDDSCYITEYELVCGLEEGELVEEPNPDYVAQDETAFAVFDSGISVLPAEDLQPVVVDDTPVHHHTDDCYEEVLVCGLPEHHHTVNCLADPLADVEDEDTWREKTNVSLDELWTDNLLAVAKTQLGYEQSERNFELDGDDGVTLRHYTRYGAWYGNPYGAWDVMFLSYCLNYADIPQSVIPQVAGTDALHSPLRGSGYMGDFSGDLPTDAVLPGDIVIYNTFTTETVAVESDTLQVQDDSADADTELLLSTQALDAEPQTEEQTVATETVGIVSEVDEAADTLTVISGNVDGKVAEVTINASDVTSLISVATAQALAGGADTMDTPYIKDFNFNEITDGTPGGFTSIIITDGKGNPITGNSVTLNDGDSLNLKYNFSFPQNALKDMGKPVKLTFNLPKGITLDEDTEFDLFLKNAAGESSKAGKFTVTKDGEVTVIFDESFDTSSAFSGYLQFDVKATVTGDSSSDESKITFPAGTEITVKKPTDISFKKDVSKGPYMDDAGDIYIDYKLTVSSTIGWNGQIVLEDKLNNSTSANGATGAYVPGSFVLSKVDSDGSRTEVANFMEPSDLTNGTFTTGDLAEKYGKLNAGESYELTYKVKITDIANDDGLAYFGNSATLNGGSTKKTTSTLNGRVDKSGKYDPDTGKVTWTVTVKNPYGKDLNGVTVTDKVETDGALIEGGITLVEKASAKNDWQEKTIEPALAPNENKNGFTYTFKEGSTGEEYQFTYVTTVPKDENGNAVEVENKVDVKEGDKTYTDKDSAKPNDRKWSFNKSTNGSLTADTAGNANEYIAHWQLSSAVPNNWTTYQYLDHIKTPTYGKHYGYAKELDEEIRNNLLFTCVDGTTLKAALAGITVDIQYYGEDYDDLNEVPAKGTIDATDTTTPVKTFVITFTNTNKTLESPVKSMAVSSYYTHVDTSDVPEGTTVQFYNNGASYSYEHKAPKKGLIKGVTTDSYQKDNYPTIFTDSAEGDYTGHDKGIFYQLILDVTAWHENGFTDDTFTVTDTLPEGLVYKADSAKAYLGWSGWCGTQCTTPPVSYYLTDSANFTVECTDGRHLTFTFKNLTQLNPELMKSSGPLTDLIIRYTANVPDESWDRPQQVKKTYVNTAQWGEKKAEATLTLNKKTKPLTKAAEAEIKDGESRVHYTLKINPSYQDLLANSNTLTLTDVLTIENTNVTAHLDMESVKLYDYPYQEGAEALPTTSYKMSYTVGQNNKNQQTHTMKLELDDSHGYVLKYDYVLDSASYEVNLSNKAKLEGVESSTATTDTTSQKLTGGGGVSQAQIVLYKVDSLNELTRLPGATFTLSTFENGSWTATEKQFPVTNEKGYILIQRGDNQVTNGYLTIDPNVLYKMEETHAPDGYAIKEGASKFYFVFGDGDLNETESAIWERVKDTANKAGVNKEQVLICGNGQLLNYTMQNDRIWLTIQKFWQDGYGNTVLGTDAPVDSITVDLYRYPVGGIKDPTDTTNQLVKEITLKKNPTLDEDGTTTPWTYVYQGVEKDYLYYIVEKDSGNLYDVTYSTSNTDGVQNGGLLTLTNRQKLPPTGSLKVTKEWLDADGNAFTDLSKMPEVTITLTKHLNGSSSALDSVTLNPSNGWTYTWKDLDASEGVTYTVKETFTATDGTAYTTSYELDGNTLADGPSFTLTKDASHDLVIKNQVSSGAYELPSTGGAGTTPYTAVGGTIALAALVCGFCTKRRRERRAD